MKTEVDKIGRQEEIDKHILQYNEKNKQEVEKIKSKIF